MKVLVNGRSAREVVVREGHVRRVKIASLPPGSRSTTGRLFVFTKGMGNSFSRIVTILASCIDWLGSVPVYPGHQ
jgi:hypothetical protein